MQYKFFLIFLCLIFSLKNINAQSEKKVNANKAKLELRKGNTFYNENKLQEATAQYQKSLKENPNYYKAHYNYGNALYRADKSTEARAAYEKTLHHKSLTKDEKAMVYHNIGNTHLKEKKYDEAISAFKKSLRQRPNNYDTKYNLAYAQKMKQNQGGKGDNDDQQKDNKNDNKEKNNPEKSPDKMTKEEAQSILNAMRRDEQNLQEKNNAEKGIPMGNAKDW